MTINKQELLVSALHTLEVAVCLLVSFFVLKAVGMESDAKAFIGTVVLAFAAKLVREATAIPVKDWVNQPSLPSTTTTQD